MRERALCDHFRGEPTEGNTPAAIDRRGFVIESIEIHCAGTDRRLAALKRRYRDDDGVQRLLDAYETRVESACDAP